MQSLLIMLAMQFFPFVWGWGCSWAIGYRLQRPLWHVLWCGAAVFTGLVLEYLGFLVIGGLMTGNWPDEYSPVSLAYGFGWFCISGCLLSAPLVVVGYVAGLGSRAWWRRYRAPLIMR
jgi:hypothetical protein